MKDIKLPDYNHSILCTITSILKYYNIESKYNTLEKLDGILSKKYKNVVLLILDGMGDSILNNISKDGFFNKHKIDVVTSVYPSTTTAALTTYYSGKPPYETGWIAWSQYFKEYGRALDMLSHNESYLGEKIDNPVVDVFESLVNYETIFEKIEKKKVKAYEVEPCYADRRSKRTLVADNLDELISSIRDLSKIDEEKFIFCYSDKPDKLLHKFGTKSKEVEEYLIECEEKIKKLVDSLENTVIIISADHGHKDIEKTYSLYDYPELLELLIMPPSLESRSITFWVKSGREKDFEERFNSIFKDEYLLMTKDEFLSKKLLGEGDKHPKIDDFIGDFVALSKNTSIIKIENLLVENKKNKKSTHAGISKEEMEVPVVVIEK